jgi:histidinol-phosphate aminotransferase
VTGRHPQPHPTKLVSDLPATVPFVAPEALERQRGRPLRLRLGANESAFGISPAARQAMEAAVGDVSWYGDPESHDLRAALAERLGVSMEHMVVGSGIDDLLGLIVRTFLEPGETAVTSLGGYPTFAYHVAGYGGRLERVPYRDDRNDLEGLAEAANRSMASLVFLANPDNPTGTWHHADDVDAFARALPETCVLILDEAYVDFAPPGTSAAVDPDDPKVIRVRTFSKAHGMAGARIGYAVANAGAIDAFDRTRLHFGVNRVAQAGALASLHDEGFVASVVEEVARGRTDYEEVAIGIGLGTLPSATNFVAVDLGTPDRSEQVVEALLVQDVFVRRPGAPPLDRFIRVSVGTAEERAQFAEILRSVMAGLG